MNLHVNLTMLPLLVVALMIWAGIFAFLLAVDRKVASLERKLDALPQRSGENRL